jgi:hypothetical protein
MNLFSNCLGGFSFRNFAYVNVVAGLFSWFVLHNTDATVFFGIAALISMFVQNAHKSLDCRIDEIYRQMDDTHRGTSREHESIYRYIDERIDECSKSKR